MHQKKQKSQLLPQAIQTFAVKTTALSHTIKLTEWMVLDLITIEMHFTNDCLWWFDLTYTYCIR